MKTEFFEFMLDLVLDWENIPVYLPEDVEQDVDIIDVIDEVIDSVSTVTYNYDEPSRSTNWYKKGWDTFVELQHAVGDMPTPILPGFRPILI
jgi:hypothetical protein